MIHRENTISAWNEYKRLRSLNAEAIKEWNGGKYKHHRNCDGVAGILLVATTLGFFVVAGVSIFNPKFTLFFLFVLAVGIAGCKIDGYSARFKNVHFLKYATNESNALGAFLGSVQEELEFMGFTVQATHWNDKKKAIETDKGEVSVAFDPEDENTPLLVLNSKVIQHTYRDDRKRMIGVGGKSVYVDKDPLVIQ